MMEEAKKKILLKDFSAFKEMLKRLKLKKVTDPLHVLMDASAIMHEAYPDSEKGYNPKYLEAMSGFINLLPDK